MQKAILFYILYQREKVLQFRALGCGLRRDEGEFKAVKLHNFYFKVLDGLGVHVWVEHQFNVTVELQEFERDLAERVEGQGAPWTQTKLHSSFWAASVRLK